MNQLDRTIRIAFVKNGLLLGLLLLTLSIFSYYFVTQMAKSAMLFLIGPMVLSLILPIGLVVLFCYYGRKSIGGFWTLRQATTGIFSMFIIAFVIQTLGRDVVFAKFIEPDMVTKTENAAISETTAMMQENHIPHQQIEKNVTDLKKDFEVQKNVSVGKTVQSFAISTIFIFVLALVFAALFKKESLVYPDQVEGQV